MINRRSLFRIGVGAGLAMAPSSSYSRGILREIKQRSFPTVVTRIVPGWGKDLIAICDALNSRVTVISESNGVMFSLDTLSSDDSVCFTADDRYLITPHRGSSSKNTVFEVFDSFKGVPIRSVEGDLFRRKNAAAFIRATRDGHYLLVLQDSGKQLTLYNMRWEVVRQVATGLRGASAMAVSDSGTELTISSMGVLQFWSIPDLTLLQTCEAHNGAIQAISYIAPNEILFGAYTARAAGSGSDPHNTLLRAHLVNIIAPHSCQTIKRLRHPTNQCGL
jgi:hypothetical protein